MFSITLEVGEDKAVLLPRGWYDLRLVGALDDVYTARLCLDLGRGYCAAHSIHLWRHGKDLAAIARIFKASAGVALSALEREGVAPVNSLSLLCRRLPWWKIAFFRCLEACLIFWSICIRPRQFAGLHGRPYLRYLRFQGLFSFPHSWRIHSRYHEWIYREECLSNSSRPSLPVSDREVFICSVGQTSLRVRPSAQYSVISTILPEERPFEEIVELARQNPRAVFVFIEKGFVFHDSAVDILLAQLATDETSIIYGDNDTLLEDFRYDPCFRWGFSVDRSLQEDCFGPVIAFRGKTLAGVENKHHAAGRFSLLRELISSIDANKISHLPAILAHRVCKATTYMETEQVPVDAPTMVRPLFPQSSLVSIIIPTKDRLDLISRAVESIRSNTHDIKYEILVIDHESSNFTKIWLEDNANQGVISVIPFYGDFNFSKMNNKAANIAKGEILVFLNNDVEIVSENWLSELASWACRPEIGCVGALLLYPNGKVQHAGVTLGIGGVGAHVFRGKAPTSNLADPGPYTLRNVSAVTGACLAIRRDLFCRLGGFDEINLAVAFNDIDLCLRVNSLELRNIYLPQVQLIHHESATRKIDDLSGKEKRVLSEFKYMRWRWGCIIDADPYYSPHLDLASELAGIRL